MRDGDRLAAWMDETAAALGGLDILVANVSGFGVTGDDAAWRDVSPGDSGPVACAPPGHAITTWQPVRA